MQMVHEFLKKKKSCLTSLGHFQLRSHLCGMGREAWTYAPFLLKTATERAQVRHGIQLHNDPCFEDISSKSGVPAGETDRRNSRSLWAHLSITCRLVSLGSNLPHILPTHWPLTNTSTSGGLISRRSWVSYWWHFSVLIGKTLFTAIFI